MFPDLGMVGQSGCAYQGLPGCLIKPRDCSGKCPTRCSDASRGLYQGSKNCHIWRRWAVIWLVDRSTHTLSTCWTNRPMGTHAYHSCIRAASPFKGLPCVGRLSRPLLEPENPETVSVATPASPCSHMLALRCETQDSVLCFANRRRHMTTLPAPKRLCLVGVPSRVPPLSLLHRCMQRGLP